MSDIRKVTIVVPPGAARRADVFLGESIDGWSRGLARRALEAGAVTRSAKATRHLRKGDTVHAGDILEIAPAWIGEPRVPPNCDLRVPVVLEDDSFVIVDKPAGMPSVALNQQDRNTLANFLVARWPQVAAVGSALESGLVHRLDTQTSGLLVAAKSVTAHSFLRAALARGDFEKEYLALVHGDVRQAGCVDRVIAHEGRRGARMRIEVDGKRGRTARTLYEPIRRPILPIDDRNVGVTSLLRVHILTGVRHQIRVHLAALGHPIVGDALYGSPVSLPNGRHLLHATRLAFPHPGGRGRVEAHSPLPSDW